MPVTIPLRRISAGFAAAYGFLVIMGGVSAWLRNARGFTTALGVVPLFNLSAEANLPTWISALGLLWCAVLALLSVAAVRAAQGRDAWLWGLVALGFAYLATDEAAMVHDTANKVLYPRLESAGMAMSWEVPATVLAVIAALALWPAFSRQPRSVRFGLFAAGAAYVGGAAGLEHLGNYLRYDEATFGAYQVLEVLEEAVEMFAVFGAMRVLERHIALRGAGVDVRFAAPDAGVLTAPVREPVRTTVRPIGSAAAPLAGAARAATPRRPRR